jgi:DNA repair protein RecO (recombination protein O)
MIESASGLVLRTLRHGETSLIVRWLTAEAGRVSTLAKGARRSKSTFAGKLDLFVQADFTFNRSRRSDLHTLREVAVSDFHLPLRESVDRLQMAAYGTEVLEQTTEVETPLPELCALLEGFLGEIVVSGARPRLVFAYELKLLEALGLFPSLSDTGLKPVTRELVATLARADWEVIRTLQPEAMTVRELNRFLQGFLMYHLGRIPKTRISALHGV